MNRVTPLILLLFISLKVFSQSREAEVVREGKALYRSEMASWHGSDLFMEKFKDKMESIGGYLSYEDKDRAVCIFYSNADKPTVLASFSFDSTYNLSQVIVDSKERDFNKLELELVSIRRSAQQQISADTLFKRYRNTSLNFVPLSDEKGKRVYILTGPQASGVVLFGNDYLLTFNDDGEHVSSKKLHKGLIPIKYESDDDKVIIGAMHTHLPEFDELITATDICTLMLYSKYAKWKQYVIVSEKKVSIWNCEHNTLIVVSPEEWDKSDKTKTFLKPR